MLAPHSLALADRRISSRLAPRAFDQAQAAASAGDPGTHVARGDEQVDFGLWSDKGFAGQADPVERPAGALGRARHRSPSIRAPVLDGTDDLTLNRGAGWIAGTARPGGAGNIGIAAHRDGFFRGLKDIVLGDEIVLTTMHERATYAVDQIEIVDPQRVDVLQPRATPAPTLATGYPFYFVGDAPQRFNVHARLIGTAPVAVQSGAPD